VSLVAPSTVLQADSVDVVFSIFPRVTKDTYSQPIDKLHVVTTAAAARPSCENVMTVVVQV